VEAGAVIDGSKDPIASRRFDELVEEAQIAIEPVTEARARIARQAYRDFGKSGHSRQSEFWRLLRLRAGEIQRRTAFVQRARLLADGHAVGAGVIPHRKMVRHPPVGPDSGRPPTPHANSSRLNLIRSARTRARS
jgi:ribonuclease VapC